MSKLNMLVAEKVMGWTVKNDFGPRWSVPLESPYFREWDNTNHKRAPLFDTNIADAMEVFDKFPNGKIQKETAFGETTYLVDIGEGEADNKSLCIAICLAALRAVGVTDAEIGEALR